LIWGKAEKNASTVMPMNFGIDAMSGFCVTDFHPDRPGTDVVDVYEVLHHGGIGC